MINNIKFDGYQFVEEYDAHLPVFILTEETAEEWNKKARIQNTKMYIELLNREPQDYEEVLAWVNSWVLA